MRYLVLLLTLVAAPAGAQAPTAEEIRRTLAQISEITGFAVKRPVHSKAITRQEWKEWLDVQIRENVKPSEIYAEETALKLFGLAPRDFNLREATVALLGEQAAAVYDHRRKQMLFVEGASPALTANAVLVHELAHALADQHFDMKRFLEKGPATGEAQLARLAAVEGQATWIMIEAQLLASGASLRKRGEALQTMMPAMRNMAAGAYPVFDKSPLYLRETLLFPYTAGVLFQQAVVEKLGREAFAAVLRDPPVSAQQVLHPEMYFARVEPTRPPLPELERIKEYSRLTDGIAGELDFQILFTQYSSEADARRAAPAWRGGTFEVWEHRTAKNAVLRWATEWSGEDAAREVMRLYVKVLEGKLERIGFTANRPDLIEGESAQGRFRVQRTGNRVQAVEGLR
jgi:hypothetical protein